MTFRTQWRSYPFSIVLYSQKHVDYPFIFKFLSLISVTLFISCVVLAWQPTATAPCRDVTACVPRPTGLYLVEFSPIPVELLLPEWPVVRGQTKYSPLVLQVEGSCCLESGLFSQRLWLKTQIVILSRGGRPGSIPPTYNHEFFPIVSIFHCIIT